MITKKTSASATFARPIPPGVPTRMWMVLRPSGERDFMVREPLEGWAVWTKRLDATVVEYAAHSIVHVPPPKKTVPPKP